MAFGIRLHTGTHPTENGARDSFRHAVPEALAGAHPLHGVGTSCREDTRNCQGTDALHDRLRYTALGGGREGCGPDSRIAVLGGASSRTNRPHLSISGEPVNGNPSEAPERREVDPSLLGMARCDGSDGSSGRVVTVV